MSIDLQKKIEIAETSYRQNMMIAAKAPIQSKAARLYYEGQRLGYKSGLVDLARLTQGLHQLPIPLAPAGGVLFEGGDG